MTGRERSSRAKALSRRRRLPRLFGLEPNPCELIAVFLSGEIAGTYRMHDCPLYSICLDIACIGMWENFSCRACEVFATHGGGSYYTKRLRRVKWTKETGMSGRCGC